MSYTQTALVSAPVGGIPVHADLAPSIVFVVLYGLLIPRIIYNFFIRKPRAWNVIQIATVIFAIERIIWCSLRAVQANNPSKRTSGGLMNYVQVTVALGFVGVGRIFFERRRKAELIEHNHNSRFRARL